VTVLLCAHLSKRFIDILINNRFDDKNLWKGVKPNFVGLQSSENTFLFRKSASEILYVLDTNSNAQGSNMTTKAIYCILINKPRNPKDEPNTPKIFTDNIINNPKVSLSYLSSSILSLPTREHIFFYLPQYSFNQSKKEKVEHWHWRQLLTGLRLRTSNTYLSPVGPAFKWMRKKIEGIEPILTKANHFSVFTLHFKILDSEERMFCHVVFTAWTLWACLWKRFGWHESKNGKPQENPAVFKLFYPFYSSFIFLMFSLIVGAKMLYPLF